MLQRPCFSFFGPFDRCPTLGRVRCAFSRKNGAFSRRARHKQKSFPVGICLARGAGVCGPVEDRPSPGRRSTEFISRNVKEFPRRLAASSGRRTRDGSDLTASASTVPLPPPAAQRGPDATASPSACSSGRLAAGLCSPCGRARQALCMLCLAPPDRSPLLPSALQCQSKPNWSHASRKSSTKAGGGLYRVRVAATSCGSTRRHRRSRPRRSLTKRLARSMRAK